MFSFILRKSPSRDIFRKVGMEDNLSHKYQQWNFSLREFSLQFSCEGLKLRELNVGVTFLKLFTREKD
jgi:hypothetical protein